MSPHVHTFDQFDRCTHCDRSAENIYRFSRVPPGAKDARKAAR